MSKASAGRERPTTAAHRAPRRAAIAPVLLSLSTPRHFSLRLATVELRVEGQGSGVALAVTQFHVARWADGQSSELRIYLDGDQARREYERLSSQSS